LLEERFGAGNTGSPFGLRDRGLLMGGTYLIVGTWLTTCEAHASLDGNGTFFSAQASVLRSALKKKW